MNESEARLPSSRQWRWATWTVGRTQRGQRRRVILLHRVLQCHRASFSNSPAAAMMRREGAREQRWLRREPAPAGDWTRRTGEQRSGANRPAQRSAHEQCERRSYELLCSARCAHLVSLHFPLSLCALVSSDLCMRRCGCVRRPLVGASASSVRRCSLRLRACACEHCDHDRRCCEHAHDAMRSSHGCGCEGDGVGGGGWAADGSARLGSAQSRAEVQLGRARCGQIGAAA